MRSRVHRGSGYTEARSTEANCPTTLPVVFELGTQPIVSLMAAAFTMDSWIDRGSEPGFATLAVAAPDRAFALHFPQTAADLRALAAAALRMAATLDGGKGVQ